MAKKQELIERITKMLEPYEENIEHYGFTINLTYKRDEFMCDYATISFNNPSISNYVAPRYI